MSRAADWLLDVLLPASASPPDAPFGLSSPWLLLTLLGVLPLAWWGWAWLRRPGTLAVPYGAFALLDTAGLASPRRRGRVVVLGLALAAVALLALASTGPWLRLVSATQLGTVMLVLDVSGSMEARDVEPDRLSAAQAAATQFARNLPPGLKVGLVTYSSEAMLTVPPTLDRAAVLDALGLLSAGGATATGDALEKALTVGLGSTGQRPGSVAVVLLSDGAEQKSAVPALQVAEQARGWDVPVHTIALGTDEGTVRVFDQQEQSYVTKRVPPDPELLYALSDLTRGKSFAADDAASLVGVYERIRSVVVPRPMRRDLAPLLTVVGLGCLLAVAALARRPLP